MPKTETLVISIETIAELFFLFDLLMRFNLGYYEAGYLVMDRKKIVKNYLKGEFWYNFLSALPICIAE